MNQDLASGGRVLIDEVKLYLSESSIHGLKYLGQSDRSVIERIFWLTSLLAAVLVSAYMIQMGVVEPLMANPVIISFYEEEIPVDSIPFPAFTICNSFQFKRTPLAKLVSEFEKAVKKIDDNPNPVPDELYYSQLERVINLQDTLNYLTNYCDSSDSFSEHFMKDYIGSSGKYVQYAEKVTEKSVFNYTWVKNVAKKIFHSCEEMIILCTWKGAPTNCAELFYPITTEFGRCCVFNMIPIPNLRRNANFGDQHIPRKILNAWKDWNMDTHLATIGTTGSVGKPQKLSVPHHQRKAGMSSGLSILLNPKINEYYSGCRVQEGIGFRVQAHSPIDNPHVISYGKAVQPNAETFIAVSAEISIVHDDVRQISKEKRQCYFLKEQWLSSFNFYTQKNCVDECLMNITFSTCGCVRQYMPRNVNHTICRSIEDRYCVKSVKKNMTRVGLKIACKDCLPSCTQVEYKSDSSQLPIRSDTRLWVNSTTGKNMEWANDYLSIVHVFMTKDTVDAKERKVLYGFQDILANAGGLLGLTLGISMISLVEPIYFFTLRLWFNSKNNKIFDSSESELSKNIEKNVEKKRSPSIKVLVNSRDFEQCRNGDTNYNLHKYPPSYPWTGMSMSIK